jgi:Predicted solute binding protein
MRTKTSLAAKKKETETTTSKVTSESQSTTADSTMLTTTTTTKASQTTTVSGKTPASSVQKQQHFASVHKNVTIIYPCTGHKFLFLTSFSAALKLFA